MDTAQTKVDNLKNALMTKKVIDVQACIDYRGNITGIDILFDDKTSFNLCPNAPISAFNDSDFDDDSASIEIF